MRMLRSSLLVALAATVAATAPVEAQAGQINGTFTLVPAQSDNVPQAINQAISGMNVATRQFARRRLSATNQPYQRVILATTPQQVTITTDQRAPITTRADGTAMDWRREDGDMFEVSTRWEGDRLRQVFRAKAEDGVRTNVWSLSPDGRTLTLNVAVTSGRLQQPLTYRLVYQRAS
jgi:hypothetical protein